MFDTKNQQELHTWSMFDINHQLEHMFDINHQLELYLVDI